MSSNGDTDKRSFNGTCTVGLSAGRSSIARKLEAYLQAVSQSQGTTTKVPEVEKKREAAMTLEAVARVAAIPIVESGLGVTEKIYHKIKDSNRLFHWYMTLGERSLALGAQMAMPAVLLFEGPIHQLDRILCKSLDMVGERVPSIYLPPQAMYSETRQFVLRRADSVKQLGSAVLDSRVTAVTATALDRALTTADKYVDKYLPPDNQDASDVVIIVTSAEGEPASEGEGGRACAAHAVQHGARLSRKLQRRLTRQALAEAKAIKEQIHVLAYVAELVATDPAQAWKKAKELYASLSMPEPENQARPDTLEELMVLLTREAARRMVHLINYTRSDLPRNIRQVVHVIVQQLSTVTDIILKTVPVETTITELKSRRDQLTAALVQLRQTSNTYLEYLAIFLAGNEEREKIVPRSSNESREQLSINGVN